ncbi:lipoprotein HlpB [Lonepinella sp. BR2930]|uniref:lipoprotein HlpB n=1 Tax=Lonepinella sp. BR2930 TaxID=3434554 RepID=UPI003F6E0819
MNKFTKISAISLFTLFLTACDKPAEKVPTTVAPAQNTQTAQPNQVTLNVNEQNIDDVKKFLNWDAQQIEILNAPQDELRIATESKDTAKIQAALQQLTEKANQVLANADKLDIKDPGVNLLKDKAKENLVLSINFVNESFSYVVQGKQPSEEDKQKLNDTYQRLVASSQELQQIREKLHQVLAPKPAQEQPTK